MTMNLRDELLRLARALADVGDQHSAAIVRQAAGEYDEPEAQLAGDILRELGRARSKFPGRNVTMLALMEEVGELAKASFEESRERVRQEAVQVATMAMRMVLDGDSTLDTWRRRKALDPLVAGPDDCVCDDDRDLPFCPVHKLKAQS